jgi:serine beta-lactamase-like protein LACTB, mitochondrial
MPKKFVGDFRLLLGLLLLASFAQAQAPTFSPEKRALAAQAASDFMAASSVPGLSIAVVLDGQPVWSAGFGMADLENSVPATSATLFRLASVSKPITATALLQLWERGKLDLDAPAQKYCPAFPQKEFPITTRELLGHLGGIRHYNTDNRGDIPADSARHFSSMEESLTIFANDPLVAKPGTKFQYSTYGYTVLGCVLEGASAQKYTDYVRENIFRPARMDASRADDFFAVIPHRTRWYHKSAQGAVENAGVLDSSYKIPGGGWLSSADDLARFVAAIFADSLIKRATRDLMWTAEKTTSGEQQTYALGWGLTNKYGLALIGHTGGQQGTSTVITLAPERQAAIVVLANIEGVDVYALADHVLRIALALPEPTPQSSQAPQSAPGNPAVLAELAKIRGDFVGYLKTKQPEPILKLYAEDAVFLRPDGLRFAGLPAIRAHFAATMVSLDGDLTLNSLNTEVAGDLAYDSGEWRELLTTVATGAKTNLRGDYVLVLRRTPSGAWKIVQHVWTMAPVDSPPR